MRHPQRFHAAALLADATKIVAAFVITVGVMFVWGRYPEGPFGPSSAADIPTQVTSGPPWTGQGRVGLTQDEAEAFDRIPLYWLGPSFQRLNLQAIIHNEALSGERVPEYEATDSVGVHYGVCVPHYDRYRPSCPVPLVVMVESNCTERPEWIEESVTIGSVESIRGNAQVMRFGDGHARIWTGEVSIFVDASVDPSDPSLVDRVIESMFGLNRIAASGGAGDELPAPDFSDCPPIEGPSSYSGS